MSIEEPLYSSYEDSETRTNIHSHKDHSGTVNDDHMGNFWNSIWSFQYLLGAPNLRIS